MEQGDLDVAPGVDLDPIAHLGGHAVLQRARVRTLVRFTHASICPCVPSRVCVCVSLSLSFSLSLSLSLSLVAAASSNVCVLSAAARALQASLMRSYRVHVEIGVFFTGFWIQS